MTLLLKISRVGVKRESMENEELDGEGDDGDTREEGLSLSFLHTPRGSDGEGLSRSLDLTGRERCVLERTSVEVCGERNNGLEESVQLLRGLLLLFMYVSISSTRLRLELGVLLPLL